MNCPSDAANEQQIVRTPEGASEVLKEITSFLGDYEPPLDVLGLADQAVAHALWGWWLWMTEQARIVARAKEPAPVLAVSPLVRSVAEHAGLMLWLADTRSGGLDALYRQREAWQRQLWNDYEHEHGKGPAGINRPAYTASSLSAAERRLDDELRSVQQRLETFENGLPYYLYRSMSDYVHANLATSRSYAPVEDDGTGRLLSEPEVGRAQQLREAQVVAVAVWCCQGAMIFRRELDDPSLNSAVSGWLMSMGIKDELPARRQIAPEVLTSDLGQLAREVLSKFDRVSSNLRAIADGEGPQPASTDTAQVYKRLIGALDRLHNALTG